MSAVHSGQRRAAIGMLIVHSGAVAAVITEPRTLDRIRSLVIPPAWENVWVCADPREAAVVKLLARNQRAAR
jgi:DNA topoisomerase IB